MTFFASLWNVKENLHFACVNGWSMHNLSFKIFLKKETIYQPQYVAYLLISLAVLALYTYRIVNMLKNVLTNFLHSFSSISFTELSILCSVLRIILYECHNQSLNGMDSRLQITTNCSLK